MKNSDDTIGNRTRDLRTCSSVPQPTAPLLTPGICTVHLNIILPSMTRSSEMSFPLYEVERDLVLMARAEETLLFRGILPTFTCRLLLAASRWIRYELAHRTAVHSVRLFLV